MLFVFNSYCNKVKFKKTGIVCLSLLFIPTVSATSWRSLADPTCSVPLTLAKPACAWDSFSEPLSLRDNQIG